MWHAVAAVVALFGVVVNTAPLAPRQFPQFSNSTALKPLTFTSEGTFQISIFEDLHFGENAWNQWGPQQDINTERAMNAILDAERGQQQLVVLNGDLITGENAYLANATHYVDRIVAPLVQRGLSWASAYGNHDYQFNLSAAAILEREHMFPGSRTARMVPGPDAGVSNYYLPVYGANCTPAALTTTQCAPELLLWFFDSRGGVYYQTLNDSGNRVGQPNWVDSSVVSWFRSTNAQLVAQNGGRPIPSLAFVHIPTNASRALQTEAGVDAHRQPGIDDDLPLAQQAQGWCEDGTEGEGCEYGGQDGAFMEAVVGTPGVIGLFSGHDHGDTWCYKWGKLLPGMTVAGNGVHVCFGQHSGYGGYGNWARGSRQVRVTREMLGNLEAETWIRLETGDVVGNVMLNSTYNQTEYPATPNTKTYCPTCDYSVVTPMPGTRE